MGKVRKNWEMACPKCGHDDEIDIAAIVWVRLTPDGTDADESEQGGAEWEDDSACTCNYCGHDGTIATFKVTESTPDHPLSAEELDDLEE